MGPAFETFLGALFLLALIAIPVVLLLRKPLLQLWRNLRTADRKQLEGIERRERERKEEEACRLQAINELRRDCHIEDSLTEEQAKRPGKRR